MSHRHALTHSHPQSSHNHIVTPSHTHTLTSSIATPSHPHSLTPSHPHTLTPSQLSFSTLQSCLAYFTDHGLVELPYSPTPNYSGEDDDDYHLPSVQPLENIVRLCVCVCVCVCHVCMLNYYLNGSIPFL